MLRRLLFFEQLEIKRNHVNLSITFDFFSSSPLGLLTACFDICAASLFSPPSFSNIFWTWKSNYYRTFVGVVRMLLDLFLVNILKSEKPTVIVCDIVLWHLSWFVGEILSFLVSLFMGLLITTCMHTCVCVHMCIRVRGRGWCQMSQHICKFRNISQH